MNHNIIKNAIFSYDDRRDLAIPGDLHATLHFCADHFMQCAEEAIHDHGYFAVALAGGSTPKGVYQKLTEKPYAEKIDWNKVKLFWSDERSVPPSHPDSNYCMAMEAAFSKLPIPASQIYRMVADEDIELGAQEYENLIKTSLQPAGFDLVLLGMGDDGHTASLFPQTHALHVENRLVVANFVPKLNTWRMTLTYECINKAHRRVLYVFGKNKADIVKTVLNGTYQPDLYPVQNIGIRSHKALWILDTDATAKTDFIASGPGQVSSESSRA
jgi:6-phosphogluconolactonase